MALKAGYRGIKKYIADKLNRMNPGDSFATDAEIAAAVEEAIETSEEYTDNVVTDTVGWIGGNLLIFPYDAQTTTYAWGTVTVNGDGSITVNGITTERTSIKLETPAMNYDLPNRSYILSLENAQSGTALLLEGYNGVTWVKLIGSANVSNPSVSVSIDHNGYTNLSVYISIESGTTLNNVTFKPMISKRGGLFVPYHPSVEESLAEKCNITALGTQEGATASRLYHPGEHFYKDGKFCTVIGSADVAADSTWTLNTNYVEGAIADSLNTIQTSFTTTQTLNDNAANRLVKVGNIVYLSANFTGVTEDAYTALLSIPSGYRPSKPVRTVMFVGNTPKAGVIYGDGNVTCVENITSDSVYIESSWTI